jgi:hypothetical protein
MSLKTPLLALTTALFLSLPAMAQDILAEFATIHEAKKFAEGNGLILVMGNFSTFTLLTPAEFEAAKSQAVRVKEGADYVRLFGYVVTGEGKVVVKGASGGSGGGGGGGGGTSGGCSSGSGGSCG